MVVLYNYAVIKVVDALGVVISLETGTTRVLYTFLGILFWLTILILDFYVYYNIIKSKK